MRRLVLHWFLLRVIGRRILLGYGVVALLSVAILASLYMASRYGLEAYVADQLGRVPWEISVIQRGETYRFAELQDSYRQRAGVREVQGLGFLRVRNLSPVRLEVANQAVPIRWVVFVSVSNERFLPPELRRAFGENSSRGSSPRAIEAALVGAPGNAANDGSLRNIRAGSAVRFAVALDQEGADTHSHDRRAAAPESLRVLLEGELASNPLQIDRQEFNKWMLREVGALSYLPEEAIVFPVPLEDFQELASQFHELFLTSEGVHGGDAAPTYVPEMTHLIAVDRERLVSSWDLYGSLRRLNPVVRAIYQEAQDLTPFSWANSDLVLLLSRMNAIAQLISLATLLVAIPLLWMGWVLAKWLGRLLVLDQRRLIGLSLIRGISTRDAGRTVLSALILGGVGGGLAGLFLGTGLPVLGYSLAGRSLPPQIVLLEALAYFGTFLIVGVALAVLSGRDVLRFVRRLTPREAIARADSETEESAAPTLSWYYAGSFLAALALGSYKIGSWIAGWSPLLAVSREYFPSGVTQTLVAVEGILNFAAVPLLLYGLAGLLLWRVAAVQKVISTLTAPLVGSLDWFVSRYMGLRRQRIAQLLFVAGMATSLSLMPQVAGDGFYDRVVRGVKASLGADLLLEFDLQALSSDPVGPAPLGRYQEALQPQLSRLRERIAGEDGVARVEVVQQFLIPGIYIPSQSGLLLNLVDDPGNYLSMVQYEDGLGLTRSFPETIASLEDGNVLGSQGLFRLRAIQLEKPVILGYGSRSEEIRVQFGDIVAFLPGQPARGIEQREGFVTAEVDYLNYLLATDARMVASRQQLLRLPDLGELTVVPSRAVFLISVQDGVGSADLIARLSERLPWKIDQARWEGAERERLGKDMFVSLALENMRVYMVGSLLLAFASVLAIALANFLADKRTFGLLRLRGLAPSLLLRISLSFFLLPVMAGVLVGIVVGTVSGFGLAQAIWDLPRVQGIGGFLANHLTISPAAVGITVVLSAIFAAVAWGFGSWLFRRTARESIREG